MPRLLLIFVYLVFLIYFVRVDMFKEGLSAIYIFSAFLIAFVVDVLRVLAVFLGSSGVLLFRFSILGPLAISVFVVLFVELLALGRNNFAFYVPLFLLIGGGVVEVFSVDILFVGSGFYGDFYYVYPSAYVAAYVLAIAYYIVFSVHLIRSAFRKSGRLLHRGFVSYFLVTVFAMFMFFVLFVLEFLGVVSVFDVRVYFAATGSILGLFLFVIAFRYPKAFILIPVDIYGIQIFGKRNSLELYSRTFLESRLNQLLVNQFLSAINSFSEEALRGGHIKNLELQGAYLIFEYGEFLYAVAICEKYHKNIYMLLKNIVEKVESTLLKNPRLMDLLDRDVVDVNLWKNLIDPIVSSEIFLI